MTDNAQARLPLSGIQVLDFSHAAAAPFATMFLGDMGAEIVKIEKPKRGDGSRSMGVPLPSFGPKDSEYYLALNRNKKGIVIDLGKPGGVALARRLAAKADVIVQNFRPGVMERLGLGFEDLRALRPGLVYCSISAFGPRGPWAKRPANDIIMQSVSGLMGITGEVGGGPVRIGAPISDYTTGLFALSGILGALFARDRHPEGQHVEVAMIEASLNLMCNYIPSVVGLGTPVPRLGRGHAQIVPYQAFLCSDHEYVMVGAFTREFWWNLARAVGHEEWIKDPRFATNTQRLKNRTALMAELEPIFASKTRAEWQVILDTADVPNSPVLELHDAVKSVQVVHNQSIRPIGDPAQGVNVVRSPIRVNEWGDAPQRPAPRLGADTELVLKDLLGLDAAAIRGLVEEGAVDIVAAEENENDD